MSLHCQNAVAKKRNIALHMLLTVRTIMILTWLLVTSMVQAGGTGQDQINNLTVRSKKPSKTQSALCHPVPGIPNRWTDVCGFVKPARSQSEWIIRKHGAFEINQRDWGLEPEDQTCHHVVWIHLSHVNTPLVQRAREGRHRESGHSRQPVI